MTDRKSIQSLWPVMCCFFFFFTCNRGFHWALQHGSTLLFKYRTFYKWILKRLSYNISEYVSSIQMDSNAHIVHTSITSNIIAFSSPVTTKSEKTLAWLKTTAMHCIYNISSKIVNITMKVIFIPSFMHSLFLELCSIRSLST